MRHFSPPITAFSFLLFAGLIALGGCSKTEPKLAATLEVKNTPNDRCGKTTSTLLLKEISESETRKATLEADTKAAPAKANFRKLYDAEILFTKDTQEKLETLSHCEDPVPETVLEVLKKKVATSQANVNYLGESFPDFK